MKDTRDPGTYEMTLAPKRGRGRPSTGKAKSAAERMREYRARNVTVNRDVLESALGSAGQGDVVPVEGRGLDDCARQLSELKAVVRGYLAICPMPRSPDAKRVFSLLSAMSAS